MKKIFSLLESADRGLSMSYRVRREGPGLGQAIGPASFQMLVPTSCEGSPYGKRGKSSYGQSRGNPAPIQLPEPHGDLLLSAGSRPTRIAGDYHMRTNHSLTKTFT